MNKNEIEQGLKRAVEQSTPNVLPGILAEVRRQQQLSAQGLQWTPEVHQNPVPAPARKRGGARRWVAVAAAMLLMAFGGLWGYNYVSVETVIGFDVNPSLELRVNRLNRVRGVSALNSDGQAILAGMDLKNTELNAAVNAIVGSMVEQGYLNESDNAILVSVENAGSARGEELQQWLTEEINVLLVENDVQGAVICQTVGTVDALQELAEANDISLGKAALVEMIAAQDDDARAEDLAALSIGELHLLLASHEDDVEGVIVTGNATAAERYLDAGVASGIALDYTGIDVDEALGLRVRMRYGEERMVYRVRIETVDVTYTVDVDAESGQVLAYSDEAGGAARIGEAQAKAAALAHAGISEREARDLSVALNASGRYEVTYSAGDMRYRTVIDAYSGEVVSHRGENDESSAASEDESSEPPVEAGTPGGDGEVSEPPVDDGESSEAATEELIGEEQAQVIALIDSGEAEDAVLFEPTTLWTRQGVTVYRVAFASERALYVYEIDAVTGAVESRAAEPWPDESSEPGGEGSGEPEGPEDGSAGEASVTELRMEPVRN